MMHHFWRVIQRKEEQARLRKRENDLKKCEDQISALEEKQATIDEEMTKPEIAINSVRLQELAKEQADIAQQLKLSMNCGRLWHKQPAYHIYTI